MLSQRQASLGDICVKSETARKPRHHVKETPRAGEQITRNSLLIDTRHLYFFPVIAQAASNHKLLGWLLLKEARDRSIAQPFIVYKAQDTHLSQHVRLPAEVQYRFSPVPLGETQEGGGGWACRPAAGRLGSVEFSDFPLIKHPVDMVLVLLT